MKLRKFPGKAARVLPRDDHPVEIGHLNRWMAGLVLALLTAFPPTAAHAATVLLQNGVQPSAAYAGTIDAFVTDGTTNNASPTSNYGGAGAIAVSAPTAVAPANTQGEFRSLVQFDTAPAKSSFDSQFGSGGWNVTGVQLVLTAQSPGNPIFNGSGTTPVNTAGNIDIRWLADDSWVEGTGSPGAPGATGLTFNTLAGFTGAGDEALGTYSFNGATSGLFTTNLGLTPGFVTDLLGGGKSTFELLASPGSQVSGVFFSRNHSTVGNHPILSISAVAVPEPGRFLLLFLGSVAMLFPRKRRSFLPYETKTSLTASEIDSAAAMCIISSAFPGSRATSFP